MHIHAPTFGLLINVESWYLAAIEKFSRMNKGVNLMKELLRAENVQILEGATDWKDAIRKSTEPLEKGKFVTADYKEGIITNVEELGPYICIAPHVAMPHARPEQGALKTQIAVTLFRNEVTFNREDATAKLFITLSAADSDSHLQVLVKISELLQDEEKAAQILQAADENELYGYFKD